MPESVWLALIVAVPTILTSVVVPIVMFLLNTRARRSERESDYARQDYLAERALAAAKTATAKAEESARYLTVSAARITATTRDTAAVLTDVAKQTNDKLDIIHTLVNSNMTAALQGEYDALQREVSLLNQLLDMKKSLGQEPDLATLASIEASSRRMKELSLIITDRLAHNLAAAPLPAEAPS